ncbi:MAG TPA: thioesterase family protein [Nevskiaceae bacterium]|nr:thioesterase family protein [Nevskiaceae bacterium]
MRVLPWQLQLQEYEFHCGRMPLYAHLDTERHVNNVAVLSFHLEARLQWLIQALGPDSWYADGIQLRPRQAVTQFLEQVHYGSEIICAARLVELMDNRFRLALALFQNGRCAGVQECVIGAWDRDRWIGLPEAVATALRPRLRPAAELMPLPEPLVAVAVSDVAKWPCKWPVTPRYVDYSPDRRLGELAIDRCIEEGRARPIYGILSAGFGILIARLDVTFHRWDAVQVDNPLPSGVARIGHTSFVQRGLVLAGGGVAASSEAVLVTYDRQTQRPVPVVGGLRQKIEPMMLASAA